MSDATDARMAHWRAMARPPATALKEIKGGRLAGMTDVNPQWRYQAMTEQFGPCGIGWQYTIDRLWTEPGADGEILGFAQVSVYVSKGDGWSEPIPGVGGNHLVTKEKNGLRNNDECWKMAVTDALSVALKMLGVAADIYAGLWDGSKYITAQANGNGAAHPKAPDGFDAWALDMEATALEGTSALESAWKKSRLELRQFMTTHESDRWNRIKAKAASVRGAAA